MTLTKSLGQFVADLLPNCLPEEAARIARMRFDDTIGTMIASRLIAAENVDKVTVNISDYFSTALRNHHLFQRLSAMV